MRALETSGVSSGTRRITAESTFGGGENAPAGTPKSFSIRATACTPTVSAP